MRFESPKDSNIAFLKYIGAGLALGGLSAYASASPIEHDVIAYCGGGRLKLATPEGRPLRSLSPEGWIAGRPSWSPDGHLAYWAFNLNNRKWRLMTQFWKDSVPKPISDWATFSSDSPEPKAIFSPDGRTIAFTLHDQVCLMDSSGKHARRLTHLDGTNVASAWSPNGLSIAFTHVAPKSAAHRLFIVSTRAAKTKDVTPDVLKRRFTTCDQPIFLSGGRAMACTGSLDKLARGTILQFDPNNPSKRPKIFLREHSNDYIDDAFSYSPDFHRIVLSRCPNELGTPSIWIADANGSNVKPLIDDHDTEPRSGVTDPAWSPYLK